MHRYSGFHFVIAELKIYLVHRIYSYLKVHRVYSYLESVLDLFSSLGLQLFELDLTGLLDLQLFERCFGFAVVCGVFWIYWIHWISIQSLERCVNWSCVHCT